MRGVRVLVRTILGVAIVATGVSGAILPAYADPPVAPSAPLHVVTSNATTGSLDVAWTAPASDGGAAISDYTIEYRKVGELSWTTVTHTVSTATSITVTGLDSESVYQFRVAAVNSVGTGPWSGQETTIAAGGAHSCALMADGTAQCWGRNGNGQLGDNSTTNSPVPVSVSGITGLTPATTAVGVSTGAIHSCALMADGTAQCWGSNVFGQLGNNSTTNSSVPVSVSGITGLTPATTAVSVSTGGAHSCALMADGTAQCWGDNGSGELGDNSTTNSSVPVSVSDITGSTPSNSLRLTSAFGHTLATPRPPDRTHPSRPAQLVVTGRDADSIALSWRVPADNGGKHIDLYRVNYRPNGSSSWTAFAIVPYSQLHLRGRGLRAGVTYEFQVRAHNANGLGNPSRVVSATVPVRAPAPIVVKKLWDNRVITLTWRAVQMPAHSPVTAYAVSCRDVNGESFRTRVASNVLSASIRVPAAQSYSCRLAAITDAGRGVGSERVQVSARSQ